MLIDSGADVSVLPVTAVSALIEPVNELATFALEGFDGTVSSAPAATLEVEFLDKKFRGQFLLYEKANGILGRNVLNAVRLLLDGPSLTWSEHR
jgi:hypothetical protein